MSTWGVEFSTVLKTTPSTLCSLTISTGTLSSSSLSHKDTCLPLVLKRIAFDLLFDFEAVAAGPF